jgi:hypothetical protein
MRKAAVGGYQDRLLKLIDQAAAQDKQVAQGLRNLAVGFQYEKLTELLKGGGSVLSRAEGMRDERACGDGS